METRANVCVRVCVRKPIILLCKKKTRQDVTVQTWIKNSSFLGRV